MPRNPLYLIYGVVVLGLLGFAEYRGWTWQSVNEAQVAPKTVRDNPGAYRPHYGYFPRYFGGK